MAEQEALNEDLSQDGLSVGVEGAGDESFKSMSPDSAKSSPDAAPDAASPEKVVMCDSQESQEDNTPPKKKKKSDGKKRKRGEDGKEAENADLQLHVLNTFTTAEIWDRPETQDRPETSQESMEKVEMNRGIEKPTSKRKLLVDFSQSEDEMCTPSKESTSKIQSSTKYGKQSGDFFEEVADMKSGEDQSALLLQVLYALGFSEDEINVNKQISCFHDITGKTFFSNLYYEEIVGSRSEGLVGGFYLESETTPDFDIHQRDDSFICISKEQMKHRSAIQSIFYNRVVCEIQPDHRFPGYVKLLGHFNLVSKYLSPVDFLSPLGGEINGPASTHRSLPSSTWTFDIVQCFETFNHWPEEANEWLTRERPHNWPPTEIIEEVKSLGFYLVPVGHVDCNSEDLWRISVRGERLLFASLNVTQIYCYVYLKIILKDEIRKIHPDILSSYRMKNIVYWCVEKSSCVWIRTNILNCIKTCLEKLKEVLSNKAFPHYIITGQNLINSKLTTELSNRIVQLLDRYIDDPLNILTLKCCQKLQRMTKFRSDGLRIAEIRSVILSCVRFYEREFMLCSLKCHPWTTFEDKGLEKNLQRACNILQVLEEQKSFNISRLVCYAKSIAGMLYYATFKQTRDTQHLRISRKLLKESTEISDICLKFRFANFFLMESDDYCMEIFDKITGNWPTRPVTSFDVCDSFQLFADLLEGEKDEKILLQMKEYILSRFYCDRLAISHVRDGLCSSSDKKLLQACRGIKDFFSHDVVLNVFYTTAEKWVVPEVIQYELVSILSEPPQKKKSLKTHFIQIHPMINYYLASFTLYQSRGLIMRGLRDSSVKKLDHYARRQMEIQSIHNISPTIDEVIRNEGLLTSVNFNLPVYPDYHHFNMIAYCHIKCGNFAKALEFILKSFRDCPYPYNTAYGYIKYIVFILINEIIPVIQKI